MAPLADTTHHTDDRNATAPNHFLLKGDIPNRPISGKTLAMDRHPPGSGRGLLNTRLVPDEDHADVLLAFNAIYDDFQARRSMLRALAALRGDDADEVFW